MVAPYYGMGKQPEQPTEADVIRDHLLGLGTRMDMRVQTMQAMATGPWQERHGVILGAERKIMVALAQLLGAEPAATEPRE